MQLNPTERNGKIMTVLRTLKIFQFLFWLALIHFQAIPFSF